MSISIETVKNLILQYIGGYPLSQARAVFAEGRNIAYKRGGLSSFVGLSTLADLQSLTSFGGISNILGSIPAYAQVSGLLHKLENGALNIPGIGAIHSISDLITQVQTGPLGTVTNYVNQIQNGLLTISHIGIIPSLTDLANHISSGLLEIPGMQDISQASQMIDHILYEGSGQFRTLTQSITDGTLDVPQVGVVPEIANMVTDVRDTGISTFLQNPVANVLTTISGTIANTLPTQLSNLVANGVITGSESTNIQNALTTLSAYSDNMLTHTNSITGLDSSNHTGIRLNTVLGTANGANQAFTVLTGLSANDVTVFIGGLRNYPTSYSLSGNSVYITAPNTAEIVIQYFSGIGNTNYTLTDVLGVAQSFGQDGGDSSVATNAITSISTAANTDLYTISTYINGIAANLTALSTTPAAVVANLATYSNTIANYVSNDVTAYNAFGVRVNDEGTVSIVLDQIQSTDNTVNSIVSTVVQPTVLNRIING